ncbi:2-nitropropane dioxygenase, NPD [Candidatus Koribacter versatilis Ellin345]|uniref:Nitronate monooxygenase n=1 Tax=Koribacter versatilis (strain Ellin345) TaxID=204669 RepID=Q1IKU8_KORVE|nr:nitronate monooxygenase [Candidatus Koribacter versatilis]ABF42502.1 2-nitropropane dioxygenase, NPD [Candidatus Koribacter versatilis Ellin345]
MRSRLLDLLDVQHPIFLAPLGGGPSTPELASTIGNSGGLGALAAAYLTPDQLIYDVQSARKRTDAPLNVNLFAGGYHASTQDDPRPMLGLLEASHREVGLPEPNLPVVPPDPFDQQFEALLSAKPRVFSFTFGIPLASAIQRAQKRGILVFGTATTVREGQLLASAGVDAIVAQGAEAGGQRGTFDVSFEEGLVPLRALVAGLANAVALPVIASGGIMNGREIAEMLRLGASAVQLGTVFLCTPEAGTSAPYRKALLDAEEDRTRITYAFTGRGARGIENAFMRQMAAHRDAILPFPMQNLLTRDLRKAATQQGKPEYLSLWAGTGVAQIRAEPAAQIMRRLVDEMQEALGGPGRI